MNNNDILKRLRYAFDFKDDKMVELFADARTVVTRVEVSNWMKKEKDEDFTMLNDEYLAVFLNGLIDHNRGKREGAPVIVEDYLSNNDILKKLKIALSLKSSDMVAIFALAKRRMTEPELSAFLRAETQGQYRPLQDQYLRNFIKGIMLKYRTTAGKEAEIEALDAE